MPDALPEPVLSAEGVHFVVSVEHTLHDCLITSEALERLARELGFSMNAMNTYRAFEARINSVARSLLLRGRVAEPLVLEPACFH
jgi:hypothetical protein